MPLTAFDLFAADLLELEKENAQLHTEKRILREMLFEALAIAHQAVARLYEMQAR